MNAHPWKKIRFKRQLSAYLDDELAADEADAVGERLVFDAGARQQLRAYEQLDALTRSALVPTHRPDPEVAAAHLLQAIGTDEADPAASVETTPRRHLRPALLASIGLLVTAGVALAGLRRRGLV
jgi:anti-sigma factor RsiW